MGFLGYFIRKVMLNEPITIYGDGRQIRDFNYVDGVVDDALCVPDPVKANGQICDLGGPPVSHVDFTRLLVKIAGQGSFRTLILADRKKIDVGRCLRLLCEDKRRITSAGSPPF